MYAQKLKGSILTNFEDLKFFFMGIKKSSHNILPFFGSPTVVVGEQASDACLADGWLSAYFKQ